MATKKMFGGKETPKEEMAEARALRSGAISKKQYIAGERSEGHKDMADVRGNANAIASGRMSPKAYAAEERGEKKMANGGRVGSSLSMSAPNAPTGNCGPGVRSQQDYKK